MASRKGEARTAVARRRASEMSYRSDPSEIAPHPLAVHRITQRLGVSIEVAAVVAQLAGLGPQEAAR
jgi:hypothetical protein